MRNYRPSSADLIGTVSDFLTELRPKLKEGPRYQALACVHILSMVERELHGNSLADLDENALVEAIRSGVHDSNWDRTFSEVFAKTIEQVKLSNPDHLMAAHQ